MTPQQLRDELVDMFESWRHRPALRGVSHLVAFAASVAAVTALIASAVAAVQLAASVIYGVGLAATLGVSALYHRLRWRSVSALRRIRTLDHSMIYVLIAASCTPFALVCLRGEWRVAALALFWGLAAIGITLRTLCPNAPRWLFVSTYLVMGWAGLTLIPAFRFTPPSSTVLVVAGGVLYTLGGLVYLFRVPNPSPRWFGFHEVFHAFTVVAAVCHFLAVWPLVTNVRFAAGA